MSELGVGLLWLSVTLAWLTEPRNAILKIKFHNMKLQHMPSSICAYVSIQYGLVLTQRDTGWFRFDFAISKNCNILQRTATHCNKLQHTHGMVYIHVLVYGVVLFWLSVTPTVTHCADSNISLQQMATHCNTLSTMARQLIVPPLCIHCNTHTATHCITLQHTATHCNTLQHCSTATYCSAQHHTAIHYSTLGRIQTKRWRHALQHIAMHCDTLRHTRTDANELMTVRTATHCDTMQNTAIQ